MTKHSVVIAGGGPTGLMLAGELALARVDVAIVERRATQDLAGSRAGGLLSRTIEVLDQRGIADRFLARGQVLKVGAFTLIPLDITDVPTRHPYWLALFQEPIERTLAAWVEELSVPIYRGREVTGFAQDDTGVDVELSDGGALRAQYLVGCDGGRSDIRKRAGIDFAGWDPSVSYVIAEVAKTRPAESYYGAVYDHVDSIEARFAKLAADPIHVTRAIERAITARRPSPRYVAPRRFLAMIALVKLLPTCWLDFAMKRAFGLSRLRPALRSGAE